MDNLFQLTLENKLFTDHYITSWDGVYYLSMKANLNCEPPPPHLKKKKKNPENVEFLNTRRVVIQIE